MNFKEKREIRNEEKRVEKEYLIAQGVVVIDESIDAFKELSASYEEKALEAALGSMDALANDLLERAAEIDGLVEDLSYIKLELEAAAITSKAFGTIIAKLPEAIAACKQALGSSNLDFSKLGKDMLSLKDTIKNVRAQIGAFRGQISRRKGSSADDEYTKLFGPRNKKESDPDFERKLQEKKKALEAKLMRNQVAAEAPVSADVNVDNKDIAKIDAIVGMMDSVNNEDK